MVSHGCDANSRPVSGCDAGDQRRGGHKTREVKLNERWREVCPIGLADPKECQVDAPSLELVNDHARSRAFDELKVAPEARPERLAEVHSKAPHLSGARLPLVLRGK